MALVGAAELEPRQGDGEDQHDRDGNRGQHRRAPLYDVRPPRPRACRRRLRPAGRPRLRAQPLRRCRRLSTRRPKRLNSAGSIVIVASTVRTTVSAQAIASPLRKPKLSTRMPSSAMHTVPPANKTVRPEVLSAVTAASSGVSPASRPRRYLVTMNSA